MIYAREWVEFLRGRTGGHTHAASRFRSPREPNHHRVLNEDLPRLAHLFGEQPLIDVPVWIEGSHDPPLVGERSGDRLAPRFVFVEVEDERLRA